MKVEISDKIKKKLKLIKDNILQGEFLYNFAKHHNYGEETLELLSNKELTEATLNVLQQQSRTKQFFHLKDERNLFEYNLNIIGSWVIEDYIVDNCSGLFDLNGIDKERTIIPKEGVITNQSDLINTLTGKRVEIQSEFYYRGGQYINAPIILRDNKYNNLKEENADLLIINVPLRKYLLLNINDFEAEYIESYKNYGNKQVYSLNCENIISKFKPLEELFKFAEEEITKTI